jgi:hypothetical protein
MGQVLSFVPETCWPSPAFVWETMWERTANVSALSGVLKRRAMAQQTRVIGNSYITFLEQESSPVLHKILEGIRNCKPGKTYIVVSKSQNGKTTAAMDVVVNHLGLRRNGLYLNAGKKSDIVPSLQRILKTTVDGPGIVEALVSALGISGAGENMGPSLLFLDEVNIASLKEGEGFANAEFVHDLFLSIAHEGNIVCVILTSKPEVADLLLALNGGKIRPFPGFTREEWNPVSANATGWTDIDWTVQQLQGLLAWEFAKVIDTIDTDFLEDGMTPGDAVSHVKAVLARRLMAVPTSVV